MLASRGVSVSEGLVSKIKVENLKQSEQVKLHELKTKSIDKRKRQSMTQKKPQPRVYRR